MKAKENNEIFEISIPYVTAKTRRGAIVIRPEGGSDLSSGEMRKLAQGIIWRDQHLGGLTLRDIAKREDCSEGIVGQCISRTFELRPETFPV
ncbi:MAG: hypothetical protein IT558_01605 [Alphaproteobacteria bacterium]|nr:hypothetical protein [Alphaproteobacteria bacterium]